MSRAFLVFQLLAFKFQSCFHVPFGLGVESKIWLGFCQPFCQPTYSTVSIHLLAVDKVSYYCTYQFGQLVVISTNLVHIYFHCMSNGLGPTTSKSTAAPEEELIKVKIVTAMCFYVLGHHSYPFDFICH